MNVGIKIFWIGAAITFSACSDQFWGCGQNVAHTQSSSNQSAELIWIARSCGATTAPLISAYIIPSSVQLSDPSRPPKKYLAFSHERGTVDARWGDGKTVEVVYDFSPRYGRTGQFFKQRKQVSGYKIVYRER